MLSYSNLFAVKKTIGSLLWSENIFWTIRMLHVYEKLLLFSLTRNIYLYLQGKCFALTL
uniref:Uncharacterized protein n=1 Tax=Triticum urartu TaxID=4572 RepID=A0A8R7Q685_TRIUA